MANQPVLNAVVHITSVDINGNSVAKHFLSVRLLNFDYTDGTVNVVDATGSFYFGLTAVTSLTYTIVTGLAGSHTVTMS